MVNRPTFRRVALFSVVLGVALLGSACGGSSGSGGEGSGLVLVTFVQNGVDNVQLNNVLEWRFSTDLQAASVNTASIQVREGNAFGATVKGKFDVVGSVVRFRPQLPGLCDGSDSGLLAGTNYRVQVVGHPDEFSVKNLGGRPLNATLTMGFRTREDSDPEKYQDQVPGTAPFVNVPESTPLASTAALGVGGINNNQVCLVMSENLNPCSVSAATVLIDIYERGDPDITLPLSAHSVFAANGNLSGFYNPIGGGSVAAQDQAPTNPFSWWGGTEPVTVNTTPITNNKPQKLPATVALVQNFLETKIVISPKFRTDPSDPTTAVFPDNSLIVVQLTFGIEDFGGQPLSPFAMSFTTEKKGAAQSSEVELKNQRDPDTGDTVNPVYLENGTTARIDGDAEVVQGFLLFAGDGDNGNFPQFPSLPQNNWPVCNVDYQMNSGTKDFFDPLIDALLDTGLTLNECANQTDGSLAVVWQFADFRIRGGVTVRVIGSNPAVVLSLQGITIEATGRLLVRGDNLGTAPQSAGQAGFFTAANAQPTGRLGGVGVAGGGNGSPSNNIGVVSTTHGYPGFGSPDFGTRGGIGAGHGNASVSKSTFGVGDTNSAGGGGGGHSTVGITGQANLGVANSAWVGAIDGAGGAVYGATRMLTPEAGSGGGASGFLNFNSFVGYNATGGGGGAGGGFVDLTTQGDVNIFGTVDAAGGRGGAGVLAQQWGGVGGAGGGSGGGIRVLTPFDINVTGGTLTAAGGLGGAGSGVSAPNAGGTGGLGRIVLEDSDSVITGIGSANMAPGILDEGLYRGIFDALRFKGGGLEPQGLTEIMCFGPLNPTYQQPVAADFDAGIPVTALGPAVAIVIEARVYKMKADGQPDSTLATEYSTIGYFTDSGNASEPTWNDGRPAPADWTPVDNNTGAYEEMSGVRAAADATFGVGTPIPFIQVRMSFALPPTAGPFDPGPFIDNWRVRFDHIN